ncbi:S-layer protein [Bacillus sp. FJAT-18019]|nr:S-layer protein [Bacillus sp. FJAT-18019]
MKSKSIIVLLAVAVLIGSLYQNEVEAAQDSTASKAGEIQRTVTPHFTDIEGHWAQAAIQDAVKRGYVDGYPDQRFLPNKEVTRAEFIKMAVTALKLEVNASSKETWYTPYVAAAESAGFYMTGDFANRNLTQHMTREEMSKLAVRALGHKNVEEKQWMYLASKDGILSGTAPGEISPTGTTTRAQAIVVIERLLQAKSGKELPVDQYAVAAAEVYWHKTNIFSVAPEIFNGPDNKNNTGINSWKVSNLKFAGKDGTTIQVEELLAIDWNDPRDPNRRLLPTKNKLSYRTNDGDWAKFSDDLKCYVIIVKARIVTNKNLKGYPITDRVNLQIHGYNGVPTGNSLIVPSVIESSDPNKKIYGLVIPKEKFSTDGSIRVSVESISAGAPIISQVLSRSILIR